MDIATRQTYVPILDEVVRRISAVREYIPILFLISEDRELIFDLFRRTDCFHIQRRNSETGEWTAADYEPFDTTLNVTECLKSSQFSSSVSSYSLGSTASNQKVPANAEIHYYYRRDFSLLSAEEQSRFIQLYVDRLQGVVDEALKENLIIISTVAPYQCIPKGFEQYVEVIDVPLIGLWEFSELVVEKQNQVLAALGQTPIGIDDYLKCPDDYISNFKGLNRKQVQHVLDQVSDKFGWVTKAGLSLKDAKKLDMLQLADYVRNLISEQKKQTVLKDGTVSFLSTEGISEPGGMDGFRDWLRRKKDVLTDPVRAAQYGERFPRGVLIAGLPGSGKSMMAKYAAREFGNIPLIQFSLQKMMTGVIGGTEEKLDRALKLIEASSPCVVWIDEIEKEMAGTTGDGKSDGGVASRCLARLLNWMQENRGQCFICATANDIRSLPGEFLRRGRFDRKYYTFLPMQHQCEDIMVRLMEKMAAEAPGLFHTSFDFSKLASETFDHIASFDGKFFTGADIWGLLEDARSDIFFRKATLPCEYPVFRDALIRAVDASEPYGETNYQDILDYWLVLREHPFKSIAEVRGTGTDSVSAVPCELFSFSDFIFTGKSWQWKSHLKCPSDSPYDRKLFESLKEGIEKRANAR